MKIGLREYVMKVLVVEVGGMESKGVVGVGL